jgi:hypothetical protein
MIWPEIMLTYDTGYLSPLVKGVGCILLRYNNR